VNWLNISGWIKSHLGAVNTPAEYLTAAVDQAPSVNQRLESLRGWRHRNKTLAELDNF
jgi:hypothetical protein